ncbi:MAG: hypothetical protein EAZ91_08625 [Cytophagales bacterium]|nr:MAG: hypothetical protein EAZ91_08625 [Cytophagales bacterium]
MNKKFNSLVIRALVYTSAMVLVYFLLNQVLDGRVWDEMVVSNSSLKGEYCELNNHERFFHQSSNTYSNLFFFFFGILICLVAREDFKNKNAENRMQQFPELSMLMGFCFIYLCFGSSFFHASLTWIGQRADMNGVYSLNIVLATIALLNVFYRISLSNRSRNLLIAFLLILIVAFYQVHLIASSRILLTTFILLIWVLTTINYFQFRQKRSLLIALSSFVLILIAAKIRQLDVDKIGCDPVSIFQGHSLWHLLSGMSCFLGYAFFRFSKS